MIPPDARDISISMEEANLTALWLIPWIAGGTLAPFAALWGLDALRRGLSEIWSLWIIPGMIAVVIVHEGLHGLGFLLGRVPRECIHFGIHRETMTPFAGCRVPVSATVYRTTVLLPAIIMGVLPWIVAILLGVGWLAWFSMAMLIFAAGDLIVVWATRSLPGAARVLDHPDRVGCMVIDG